MLKIFNSYTRLQEQLEVDKKKTINMYVCGITAYDFCHIGHGRTFIFFDVVVRYLRSLGYALKYVRNITDIDDKIIAASLKNNESYISLSNRMISNMKDDFSALNILPPDSEPRVTENISDIIKFISILLNKKHAYVACNGDIMFSVSSYLNYGALSNQFSKILNKEINISHYSTKKNIADFALWKTSKSSIFVGWNSPWGNGRPGWHIECSSMCRSAFKNKIDIHGGGVDLLFPHHENELAQSVCIDSNFSIKHWMHTGLVIINNEKMSKSLNNTLLLRDLLTQYDSEIIRFFLLSTHYRHPLYFCYKNLSNSSKLLKKLYLSLRGVDFDIKGLDIVDNFKTDFYKAMNSDFNTPLALSILLRLSKEINKFKLIDSNKASQLASKLRQLGSILGILLKDPEYFLQNNFNCNNSIIGKINSLIYERDKARRVKDWVRADRIRKELLELGIVLEDTSFNTFWRSLQ
ncbi:cysteine--tRNA ligase [Buchnera aphidicola]|uniref:Cysteine--tRNA ligase n=1 Tax=Buchnera aphidicola subsp. Baizongia pistaciae (strain Bp) TaxID=224915 RepID=SYC_BUCBP|nr:cysteine--tRNA ligase [Buchnera aphidicola]P59421.1 RecName: Full=Cysteine--tRNA ligase; AltName: Full=Cysteinyl-tRNA synthetase; Short=CysRS [Buchnera aphidicola str. Bp (Baizongia pistaciae)]